MIKGKKGLNFELIYSRYARGSRPEKSKLLDELCDLYGYNRKYLLQVLNHSTGKKYRRRGRRCHYEGEELIEVLKRIWLESDQLCSKRLKPAFVIWLPSYEDTYGMVSEEVKEQLLHISPATIDRLLKPFKVKYKRHGLSGTRPGYLLKNQIPIKTDHWDVKQPGFMEADTVAHCGNSMEGSHVWSITLTDILTCWTEIRATWNKGAEGVIKQIKNIEKKLPFPLLGFDCDNGSEFLNWHLIHYFQEGRKKQVQVTRSRPYRKNDNAHVEQKNWTHVRHLFGYDRFEDPRLVDMMNDLYANDWSHYQNHFMPTQKLIKKEKINSKYRKKYEKAKTPYERVMESLDILDQTKIDLALLHHQLNPFKLKSAINKKVKNIFKYVRANKKPRTKI